MKNISVWNTAFLGDTVLTLPLIQTLSANYPEASIDFYVRKGLGSLFTSIPSIRNIIEYDKHQKSLYVTKKLIRHIRQQNYDLWINAHTSIRSSLITLCSGATLRIGYKENFLQGLCCTQLVKRKLGTLDEIERLLDLLSPLPIQKSAIQHWPTIILSDESYKQADTFWDRHISGPVLGINPGSVWATKRWLIDKFAKITCMAIEQGAHVILFGGPNEKSLSTKLIELSKLQNHPNLHNLCGTLTLQQLAAFINKLNCYLTNDSGPMHIAWSQHTPVTAIFGPTVKCLGFAPRGDQSTIIEIPLYCRPCSLHGGTKCPEKHFNCMKEISITMVWEDIVKKLFQQNILPS